jgi:hypothetical protein
MDLTHIIPNPKNYTEYVRQRNERTIKAMNAMERISGRYCKEHNLSVRMIFDSGYVFDATTDELIRTTNGE